MSLASQLAQHVFEGLVGDQTDILREHCEEAAHEEFGGVLRVVAAAFQCSGNLCQTRRDVARDLSRFQHRVEALRVKRDAEGLAIREMRVVFPQAGEIREHLDDVTGIDDQQEGRVAVIDGKGAGASSAEAKESWVPAFAGMTNKGWERFGMGTASAPSRIAVFLPHCENCPAAASPVDSPVLPELVLLHICNSEITNALPAKRQPWEDWEICRGKPPR